MNDSRYATEDMFRDENKYRQILRNWENDMPRKFRCPLTTTTDRWQADEAS
jgi:hypothetical protein